ncbi:dTDP-4-dehydrorhamnose reductase [Aquisalinus flavus]|uniref:dTDP-4-dehydrorhamnose reductase n=1 Tax=Aquisalinus flavus TaxID=1526572 RepID=A0A8J2V307_9PROT|nr:dTDP-4-dehydrorhamnose reductase [Aquisalinus flavus]MBD0426220.1 dTDP-4-dehydrorhamnose reductase [Aquisalinus flavus]UNE48208.1 dTDP-4-dehydrorhamnose reductase [Aquisalinus flavus]GGD09641.1 NAD(P)-dependent oxidoreductase [Aquisalinus flavus]
MKILVFGKTGQVATEIKALGAGRPDELVMLGRDDADFEKPAALPAVIAAHRPDIVINAVAHTAVDKAESEPELAETINATAPGHIARACAGAGIPFIHISTDFVFDGESDTPYKEDDAVHPLGVYGATKLAGEQAVLDAGGQSVILRTSWVFSAHGGNFVKTMLRLAESRDELNIVADQRGQPTPAAYIADAIYTIADALAQGGKQSGIYHFSGAGPCSWADFAREIFRAAGKQVTVHDIPASEYPTPAKRPAFSVLDCSKIEADFGIVTTGWKPGLADVVSDLGEASN